MNHQTGKQRLLAFLLAAAMVTGITQWSGGRTARGAVVFASNLPPVVNPDTNENMYVARATFYDYYSDSQITSSGLGAIDDGVYGTNNRPTENSFIKFNKEMAGEYGYANTGDPHYSVRYPLYLGLFYGTQSSSDNGGYYQQGDNTSNAAKNFWLAANSSQLGSAGVTQSATQGLVDRNLNVNGDVTQANGAEILPYFNKGFLTGTSHTGTNIPIGEVWEDVAFPFRTTVDSNGVTRYQFDSKYDTVRFNASGQLDYLGYNANYKLSVQVLDQKGNDNSETLKPGFFPFNRPNEGNTTRLNYGFGVKIEIPFYMAMDGKINGQDITFAFSGDDDVWVFIDGELVLDIGGVHSIVSGEINFANQTATVSGVKKQSVAFAARDTFPLTASDIDQNVTSSFSSALAQSLSNTLDEHTLTIFRIERGKIESNMKIDFNLPQSGPNSIILTANPTAGGSPAASQTSAAAGTQITLSANPNANYSFTGWAVTSPAGLAISNSSFTMPDTDVRLTANFVYSGGSTSSGSDSSGGDSSGGGGGGSYMSGTPAYKKVTVRDRNGNTLNTSDTTSRVVVKGVMELKMERESDSYVWSINLERLNELEADNKGGILLLNMPGVKYSLPFGITNIITGLTGYIQDNTLKMNDLSLELTAEKLTGDELRKAREDYQKAFPDGEPVSGFYDIRLSLYKDGKRLDVDVNRFDTALAFTLTTTGKGNAVLVYSPAAGGFSFVPASQFTADSVAVRTKHHSMYVAVKNNVSFDDVKPGAWYASYVTAAANKALIAGTGHNLYQPDQEVTRAEFVQMMVNAMQLPEAKASTGKKSGAGETSGFAEGETTEGTTAYYDVTKGAWYYDAVMKAKSAGLLDTFTGGGFNPNQAITREEMAVILAAAIRHTEIAVAGYTVDLTAVFHDYGQFSASCVSDIELIYKLKIMQGTGNGKFEPQGVTTRAQAATVLINLLNHLSMIDCTE